MFRMAFFPQKYSSSISHVIMYISFQQCKLSVRLKKASKLLNKIDKIRMIGSITFILITLICKTKI